MKRLLPFLVLACACSKEEAEEHRHPPEEGHDHAAPHGGTLVALGEHFAHAEMVLDADTGRVTLYILDGEAEKPVRLEQPQVDLLVIRGDAEHEVTLAAAADPLTGEKPGDSARFEGTCLPLRGATDLLVEIKSLRVRGTAFAEVTFPFPRGNE